MKIGGALFVAVLFALGIFAEVSVKAVVLTEKEQPVSRNLRQAPPAVRIGKNARQQHNLRPNLQNAPKTQAPRQQIQMQSLNISLTEEDRADLKALRKLYQDTVKLKTAPNRVCHPIKYGTDLGAHLLCNHFPNDKSFPCHFLSFGINQDFSFDKVLHDRNHCQGIGLDPTVDHPIKMTPGVIFIKAGANSPRGNPEWTSWSVPEMKKWYGHPLYALKMDCEGCEYSLAQDIIRDDPLFFKSVLQFNVEIHLPRSFASNQRDILNLGKLMKLIFDSGMTLVHADNGGCGPKDNEMGCDPILNTIGFPCMPGCRSYLFSHKTTGLTWDDWVPSGTAKTVAS